MRTTLGRRGAYAVRAVLELALHAQSRRKAQQISQAMDIPHRYLPQILAALVGAGVITSEAGPNGGYSLARTADTITLLDVVTAAEGPITLDECILEGGSCEWKSACPVHETWLDAQQAFVERLQTTTFSYLAEQDAIARSGVGGAGGGPHPVPTSRRGVDPQPVSRN